MPNNVKMFILDEGGERFWYAGLTAEAVRDFHRDSYGEEEVEIEKVEEVGMDVVHRVGGDIEPGDEPEGGSWDAENRQAVGTTAQWLAEIELSNTHPVAPLWSTVY